MLIHEAAEAAGLTKKAIRYYDEQGLLPSSPARDGGYRQYSGQDVERLKLIRELRRMDFTIADIRHLIQSPCNIREQLTARLAAMERQLSQLEAERSNLETLLASNAPLSLHSLYPALRRASGHADQKNAQPSSAAASLPDMIRRIDQLFPGPYGRLFAHHFAPFLDDALASPEEQAAWAELVRYLDETEPFPIPEEMIRLYSSFSDQELYEMARSQQEHVINPIVNATGDELAAMAETLRRQVQEGDAFNAFMDGMMPAIRRTKSALTEAGYYDGLPRLLKLCSKKYARYMENMARLQAMVQVQYGDEGYRIVKD